MTLGFFSALAIGLVVGLVGRWLGFGLTGELAARGEPTQRVDDAGARAAAVRVLRYNTHRIADHAALLEKAAADVKGP